jgi:DNA-binding NarL/FixJ family response regulator/anti-sigma regulatory factor (Ser/Thr protein kinase)
MADPVDCQICDDDPVSAAAVPILVLAAQEEERRLIRQALAARPEWKLRFVATEKEALKEVVASPPAILLMDMQDVEGSALDFLDTMRRKHALVSVVVLLRRDDAPVFQALRHGAVNYVPWSYLASELSDIVESVLLAGEVRRCKNRLLAHVVRQEMAFAIGNDTTLIPGIISLFQEMLVGIGICDTADSIRVNMAMEEALLNAIYHGNLEVSSTLRNDPERGDEPYREEIERRRRVPPFRDRRVHVSASFSPTEAQFVISDQGPGFDPSSLPDPTDPANIELASGRGLLLIRTFMDDVQHNAVGNEITMVKRKPNK